METLDGKTIYQIFVRNYSEAGNFKSVTKDLERIKELGVDIIYLMPIHEIGEVNRKGTYGSPYAIKDYFSISKDLGTKRDLIFLINKAHELGMSIILDMVFNHTAPDNVLVKEHLDYYYLSEEGMPGNRIGEWDDIIDLNVKKKEVQDYLISVLRYWREYGFDGFRFDVASIIPLEFFARARLALGNDVLFFAESISPDFKRYLRKMQYYYEEDEDLLPTFDLLYNYNYLQELQDYLRVKDPEMFRDVVRAINKENIIHHDIIRSNCLENHDVERVANNLNDSELINMLTMFISLRGCAFLYAGEEYGIKHKPELFEKDPVEWSLKNEELYYFVKELIELKKDFGVIEDQNIEEIGELSVYKMMIRNKEKERVFLINLTGGPVLLEDILKETYDGDLEAIIKEKIDEGDIILTDPLIFTFLKDQ